MGTDGGRDAYDDSDESTPLSLPLPPLPLPADAADDDADDGDVNRWRGNDEYDG